MRSRGRVTKSHARGVVILIFIVLVVQTGLFVFNSVKEYNRISEPVETEEQKGAEITYSKSEKSQSYYQKKERGKESDTFAKKDPFYFDPNTIDMAGMLRLGLSQKEAQVIINYRSKGGKFRKSVDLSKIYVLTEENYNRIKDYAVFESGEVSTAKSNFDKDTAFPLISSERPAEVKVSIDLNSADSLELVSLPGIGPYFAKKIIDYRERLGGYVVSEQLMEIYGIDKERFSIFSDRVWADRSKVTKLKLSEASAEDLSRNPYIGAYVARSIVKYRESVKNNVVTVALLVINKILKEEVGKILEYYFE